ncbi:MAG: urease accessory protein UreD, partial [Bradyrhizobium sp.]
MRADPASAAADIFEANRARGAVRFDVLLQDGMTRRHH